MKKMYYILAAVVSLLIAGTIYFVVRDNKPAPQVEEPKKDTNMKPQFEHEFKATDPQGKFGEMIDEATKYAKTYSEDQIVVVCSVETYDQIEQYLPSISGITGSYREDNLEVIFFTRTKPDGYLVGSYK